jgi:hypothetical protein
MNQHFEKMKCALGSWFESKMSKFRNRLINCISIGGAVLGVGLLVTGCILTHIPIIISGVFLIVVGAFVCFANSLQRSN